MALLVDEMKARARRSRAGHTEPTVSSRATPVLAVLVLLALPPLASAQDPDPDEFTPRGYEFCGWKDFTSGGWRMEWDDSLAGAYLVAFADGMTCRAARQNVTRTRFTQRAPHRPVRLGYRCQVLDEDLEYSDIRCVARKGASRKFRFQTGS